MAPLDHGPAAGGADDTPLEQRRNARIGMLLFIIYTACYTAFVLTAAFAPQRMATRPWADINLAIWSGFGLLVLALVLSLVYSWLCRARGVQ
jgi:uncharacterized membrane protein (DUF485 family)